MAGAYCHPFLPFDQLLVDKTKQFLYAVRYYCQRKGDVV